MPVIPKMQRTAPGTVRAVSADVAGPAVTQLGRTVQTLGLQMEKARQTRETNEAVTEAQRQMLAHEDDLKTRPDEFASWTGQHDEFLKTTRDDLNTTIEDSTVRDAVNQRLNTFQVHSEVRVRQGARGKEIQEGRAAITAMEDVLSDNYAKMRAGVDRQMIVDGIEDAYEEAADTGIMTPEEVEQRKQLFTNRAEKLRAAVDIDEDPTAALANIQNDVYDVEPQDKLVLKESAEREIAREQKAREAAAAERQQGVWTALFDGIDQDTVGRADLERAFNTIDQETGTRQISEQGMRSLLGQLRRHEKDKAKLGKSFKLYEKSISDGEALDYKLKDHRDAAEAAFIKLAPELADLDSRSTSTRLINELLRPTKIWPKSLMSQMRITAKSTNMDAIEGYSDLYDRVSSDPTVSPVNKSMVSEDQAFWESVGQLRRAGMFTREAIETAKHNAFELTDDDRAALKQRYKAKEYTKGNKLKFNEVKDRLDPGGTFIGKLMDMNFSELFEGAPDAPPGMVADYQNLVRIFFDQTGGDIELARKLAGENLERAWATEDIEDGT